MATSAEDIHGRIAEAVRARYAEVRAERIEQEQRAERLEEEKLELEGSLSKFIRAGWKYIDPSPYLHNWHIDIMCEHLELVTAGECRRLILNVPPRHMKSIAVSVAWPAWTWARSHIAPLSGPQVQFLTTSYAQILSTRDSRKSRLLMNSPWYQELWGDRFSFVGDQNAKQRYENDQGGYRIAAAVRGQLTGDGGMVVTVDDAHNMMEVVSPVERQNVLDWWDEAMPTRLNDPKTGAFVIIMQRLHETDLVGHVLERELGWEHVCLPAEYERDHPHVYPLDPRKVDGELLWPERIGPEELDELKARLGPFGSAGQLQQRPAPRGGGFFELEWIRYYDERPKHLQIYLASDYAVTEGEGDYTVHLAAGVDPDDNIYILDIWREQTASDVWVEALLDMVEEFKPLCGFEEQGQIIKSVGPLINLRMKERKAYYLRKQFTSTADKATRAQAIRGRMAASKVYFPRHAPWLADMTSELLTFPAGRNDDQVDALSLLGRALAQLIGGKEPVEDKPKPKGTTFMQAVRQIGQRGGSDGRV